MKERPILFSAPMVRAIRAGKKTQTRRIAVIPAQPTPRPLKHEAKRPGPYFDAYCSERKSDENRRGMSDRWCWWTADDRPDPTTEIRCPYGAPGDRLWVRETWCPIDDDGRYIERIPDEPHHARYRADLTSKDLAFAAGPWRPSIHMPRWASRITLEVTEVRVPHLQDINEDDARAEGVDPFFTQFSELGHDQRMTSGERVRDAEHRASFAVLWDEINRDRALWISNPRVWAITFKRVMP